MLFQGQEFAASSPFLYFADYGGDLARDVAEGRRKFLSQFPSIAAGAAQARLDDPADPGTFQRSLLDHRESGCVMPLPMRCIAICWLCAATTRCWATDRTV